MRLGHFSVRVGDGSRCNEQIVKKLDLRLSMHFIIIIIIIISTINAAAAADDDSDDDSNLSMVVMVMMDMFCVVKKGRKHKNWADIRVGRMALIQVRI